MRRYSESDEERNEEKIFYSLWEQTLIRHWKKVWYYEARILCYFEDIKEMLMLFMRSSLCFEVKYKYNNNLVAKSCNRSFWSFDNIMNSMNSVIQLWS